tara:strand:+ start:49 stop:162 length:114 start_codon:yes stop_codon:yes gene_type:complete
MNLKLEKNKTYGVAEYNYEIKKRLKIARSFSNFNAER